MDCVLITFDEELDCTRDGLLRESVSVFVGGGIDRDGGCGRNGGDGGG